MANKKRNSNVVEEVENLAVTGTDIKQNPNKDTDGLVSAPPKKKMKNDKRKNDETADANADSGSIRPMERKKKRKAIDKERHRSASENKEPQPKEIEVASSKADENSGVNASSSSNSGMPEFHISVFKDLASADVSLRHAAAESLVTELQEVQKAYETMGKEVVEGELKLEAEKDDGLNDCAPSLRYAVRRLIRGVSSSREVCVS